MEHMQGRRERVRDSVIKKVSAPAPPPPTTKGGPAKNLYTKSERLSVAERLVCRVNLYS
jgi:hypothetical protein